MPVSIQQVAAYDVKRVGGWHRRSALARDDSLAENNPRGKTAPYTSTASLAVYVSVDVESREVIDRRPDHLLKELLALAHAANRRAA